MNVSRRRYMGEKGGSIPYQRIEYLEHPQDSSKCYILTNISGDARIVFTAQANILNSKAQVVITSTDQNRGTTWAGVCTNNKWGVGSGSGNYTNISGTTKVTADINFYQTSNTSYADGSFDDSSVSRYIAKTTGFVNWRIFQSYNETFYGKVFSVQIYQNDTLVGDFIPVRVGTTGYMYDTVSGQLFGNSGTGDFVLGPDVTDE